MIKQVFLSFFVACFLFSGCKKAPLEIEEASEDSNSLIRYAEHALYNAKQSGKNKIVEFSTFFIL